MSNPNSMKKPLLVTALILGMGCYQAGAVKTPTEYADGAFQSLSPSGQYAISDQGFGIVTIYDFVNDKSYVYGEETFSYSTGLGNAVSNNGIVLASTTNNTNAAYWSEGKWIDLNVPNPNHSNMANGITPDGSRICGSIGNAAMNPDEDNTMLLPAYWDRQADGSYGECHTLPHPDLDYTGRAPQYITAISISDDGKTIAGLITDCPGQMYYPIVYQQADNGEWSYKILCEDKVKPATALPEYPGESPAAPQATDYMTDEAKAKWEEDYKTWQSNGYNPDEYPVETGYMTEEQQAKYTADKASYDVEFAEWDEKSNAYYDAYYEYQAGAPAFVFNAVLLSPDGKTYLATNSVEDPTSWAWPPVTQDAPWAIDIATGEVSVLDFGMSISPTQMPNSTTVLAYTGLYSLPSTAYIIELDPANAENNTCTPLHEWLSAKSDDLKEWMESKLMHEVESYDDDYNPVFDEYLFTGMTLASSDLSKLTFWHVVQWEPYETQSMAYLVDLNEQSGLENTVADTKLRVSFDASGNLCVGDGVATVEVFDLAGRRVFNGTTGKHSNELGAGVYVVKATGLDGSSNTSKVIK